MVFRPTAFLSFFLSINAFAAGDLPVERAFDRMARAYQAELSAIRVQLELDKNPVDDVGVAQINLRGYGQKAVISVNPVLLTADSGLQEDHWQMVLCHELGHLLGGAPYKRLHPDDAGDVSAEGQADYFAAAKCLRTVWPEWDESNAKFVRGLSGQTVRLIREQGCETDQCIRIVQRTFEALIGLYGDESMRIDRRSTQVIPYTHGGNTSLPADCRLDTVLAGALCPVSPSVPMSVSNQRGGSCTHDDPSPRMRRGARPVCWFNPVSLDRSI